MKSQDNKVTSIEGLSVIADRFEDDYFLNRVSNDPLRMKQFAIDSKFLKQYVSSGNLCDVGCSTGEFVNFLDSFKVFSQITSMLFLFTFFSCFCHNYLLCNRLLKPCKGVTAPSSSLILCGCCVT